MMGTGGIDLWMLGKATRGEKDALSHKSPGKTGPGH